MVHDKYERGLEKCPANYTALTPLYFLQRAAEIYPGKTAIIYGDTQSGANRRTTHSVRALA